MILLSWNCRGLGNPRTVQDLCQLVKNKQPSLLFLMETISKRQKLERLRIRLGFEGMFAVDPVGRSGGLVLFWKEDSGLEIQNYSRRHINAVINDRAFGQQWKFTGFYGNPNPAKREESWALLRDLQQFSPQPWLCVGDFNEITEQHEKEGENVRRESQMEKFWKAIDKLCTV
jgi:hypothetical protein